MQNVGRNKLFHVALGKTLVLFNNYKVRLIMKPAYFTVITVPRDASGVREGLWNFFSGPPGP